MVGDSGLRHVACIRCGCSRRAAIPARTGPPAHLWNGGPGRRAGRASKRCEYRERKGSEFRLLCRNLLPGCARQGGQNQEISTRSRDCRVSGLDRADVAGESGRAPIRAAVSVTDGAAGATNLQISPGRSAMCFRVRRSSEKESSRTLLIITDARELPWAAPAERSRPER